METYVEQVAEGLKRLDTCLAFVSDARLLSVEKGKREEGRKRARLFFVTRKIAPGCWLLATRLTFSFIVILNLFQNPTRNVC